MVTKVGHVAERAKQVLSVVQNDVIYRDKSTCVVPWCSTTAKKVHYLMDGRLFPADDPNPNGCDLANAVLLCDLHRRHAEQGFFPPQAIRHWCDLPVLLPKMCDSEKLYDKCGNEIPLSAQACHYPKMPSLPLFLHTCGRPGNLRHLSDKPLVTTIKMDGTGVVLTRDSWRTAKKSHNVREGGLLDAQHQAIKNRIPKHCHLFGEWLVNVRHVRYVDQLALPAPLLIFAIYDQRQQLFWDWNEICSFCQQEKFTMVPSLGQFSFYAEWQIAARLRKMLAKVSVVGHEGIVVRNVYPYHYTQHSENAMQAINRDFVSSKETDDRNEIRTKA